MSVRLADRWRSRATHPEAQASQGHRVGFERSRHNGDTLAKCLHFGPMPRGVWPPTVSERRPHEGGRVDEPPAKAARSDPPQCRSGHGDMAQRRDCDRPLRHQLAGAGRSGEQAFASGFRVGFPGFTRAANAKARDTARSASPPPRWQGTDAACNGMQLRGDGGAGRHPSPLARKGWPKATSKGDKAQGGQAAMHPQKCTAVRTSSRSKASRDRALPIRSRTHSWKRGCRSWSRIGGGAEVRGGNERGDAPRLRGGGVLRGV